MKKSFLKRVMAAAIAVPVALSQTVLFTSFADGETAKVLSTKTFTDVESDVEINVPTLAANGSYKAPEAGTPYAYVQESDWYEEMQAAVNDLIGTTQTLNTNAIAQRIESNEWWSDEARDIFSQAGAVKATATVNDSDVTVVFDINYNYSQQIIDAVYDRLPEYDSDVKLDLSTSSKVAGTVTVKIDTSELASKKVSATVETNIEGLKGNSAADAAAYVQSLFDAAKADVEAAVAKAEAEAKAAGDTDKAYRIGSLLDENYEEIVADYQKRVDRIKKYLDKADNAQFKGSYEHEADADALLADVKADLTEKFPNQKRLENIPNSIDEAVARSKFTKASELLSIVVGDINANETVAAQGYSVELTSNDIVEVAKSAYDITAEVDAAGNQIAGEAWGYLPDEVTDYSIYTDFITKELAKQDLELDGEIQGVKVFEAEGSSDADALTAEGTLNVYRVIYFEVKEIEETTEDTTEETTEDTTGETEDTTGETDVTEEPTEVTEEPTGETEEPTEVTEEPTGETEEPTGETEEPTGETEEPTGETEEPTGETEEPTGETEEPTGETQNPTGETEDPTAETMTPTDVPVAGNITDIEVDMDFYFSHDPNAFDPTKLIKSASATVTNADGTTEKVAIDDLTKFCFGMDLQTPDPTLAPQDVYANKGVAYVDMPVLYVFYANEDGTYSPIFNATADNRRPLTWIGVKGDVTLDGDANAKDASEILRYATEKGVGQNPYINTDADPTLERFAWFLGDVNGESKDLGETVSIEGSTAASDLNAVDASYILAYATKEGTAGKGNVQWVPEVLEAPYPAYSLAIAQKKGLV